MLRPEEVFKEDVPDFLTFFFLMSKSASLALTNSGDKSCAWSALTGVGCIGAEGAFGEPHIIVLTFL
jgi:hypothetical protein